jgi:DNA ligase (NAD+)
MSAASAIDSLVTRLTAAAHAYHNGLTLLMTDAEYDAAIDQLTAAAPDHPFLRRVGAPVAVGDEVALPIPLPSLNKIKAEDGSLAKWLDRNPSRSYHLSGKLDGVSALWLPASRKLYTRGDGMRGRDISAFVPHLKGFPSTSVAGLTAVSSVASLSAVRGELIMRTDSPAIPAGKLARNIVAGAMNRKEVDPALFAEIRFVAYEVVEPATLQPLASYSQLSAAGYELPTFNVIPAANMTPANLSATFSSWETTAPYQLDGIVVAPNQARTTPPERVRKGEALNPADRVAWKTRQTANTATTTVHTVEWNVSSSGYLIPRVLFDTVTLAGANISAATGLHGRWIMDNAVGPGSVIEVRRAGDVIPQIIAVHTPSPTGPAMPPEGTWVFTAGDVHIQATDTETSESACVRLTHALTALGAENVGPGQVARLYAAGFKTLRDIYAATPATLAARVEGVKAKGADRIYEGLRAGQASWTELSLMLASSMMPRGIGSRKLTPLLQINPNPASWPATAAALKAANPAGLSTTSIDEIVGTIPAYLAWRAANFGDLSLPALPAGPVSVTVATVPSSGAGTPPPPATIVLTGFRDKTLEAQLAARGHTVADAVTKKTTHVVYPDGAEPASTKITKAREIGTAQILSLSAMKSALLS